MTGATLLKARKGGAVSDGGTAGASSGQRFAYALEATRDGLWEWHLPTSTLAVNRAWLAMLGYTEAEFTGDISFWEPLLHLEDAVGLWGRLSAAIIGDQDAWESEHRLRHKEGHWVWVLGRGRVVERAPDGTALRMAGTTVDITERKRIEAERQAALDRFEMAMRGSQTGIWSYDVDSGRRYRSPHLAAILGYTGEHAAEWAAIRDFDALSHPDDMPGMEAAFDAFLRGETAEYEYVWRMRHRDGSWRWMLSRARAERRADGTARTVTGIFTDITERKHMEEELRAALERFDLAAAATRDALFDRDLVTGRAYYSPRWDQIIGLPLGRRWDPDGDAWQEILHPEDRERNLRERADLIAGRGGTFSSEYRVRHADGGWRWIRTRAVALRGPDGAAYRLIGTHSDVTEERERTEALRLSEERFRSLAEATSMATWSVPVLGQVEPDVPSWREFTGQTSEQIRGRGWMDALHPDDRAPMEAEERRALETGTTYQIEYRVRRHDGVYRWLRARAVPVRGDDGAIREWVGTLQDVTERRAEEEERALRAERDRRIARTLQESLMPALRPELAPGLDVAAVCVPLLDEASVGGDFYDVFPLPGGRTAVLVGDVMGKGLTAALSIAEVRFALRGFLRETPDRPSLALRRLNRFLLEAQELEQRPRNALVALSLAVLDGATGEAQVAVAGAEAPLVVRAGGAGGVESLEEVGDLVLGADRDTVYAAHAVRLGPGDVLALTTDGLAEARRPGSTDLFDGAGGLWHTLRSALASPPHSPGAAGPDSLDTAARYVVERARAFAGGALRDDVCLLLARRQSP